MNEAFKYLTKGHFNEAFPIFSKILDNDPNDTEATAGFRICRYWMNRADLINFTENSSEQIHLYIEQWQTFEEYVKKFSLQESESYQSVMLFIHKQLSFYLPFLTSQRYAFSNNPDILVQIASHFVKFKDWSGAIQSLEAARSIRRDDARILALLGECYFQTKNEHRSLVMFREAFFIDPQQIPLDMIQSDPLLYIINEMKIAGIPDHHLSEWLPVFATLYNVFNVKRSLSRNQLEELQQKTLRLEESLRTEEDNTLILPRLINHYLWLLDFFVVQEKNELSIREIVNRLRSLDNRVYSLLLTTYNIEQP